MLSRNLFILGATAQTHSVPVRRVLSHREGKGSSVFIAPICKLFAKGRKIGRDCGIIKVTGDCQYKEGTGACPGLGMEVPMQYKFVGRNMDVSQRLKNLTERKLKRLSKFFTDDTTVCVTFKEEGRQYRVEITIPVKGTSIRSEVSCDDCYTGVDKALERLESQIVRYRSKLTDKAKGDKTLRAEYFAAPAEAPAEEKPEEFDKIVRVKEVEAPVLELAEAELQLELTGHDFYVFRDAETGKVCIIYRRREGANYGLIKVTD